MGNHGPAWYVVAILPKCLMILLWHMSTWNSALCFVDRSVKYAFQSTLLPLSTRRKQWRVVHGKMGLEVRRFLQLSGVIPPSVRTVAVLIFGRSVQSVFLIKFSNFVVGILTLPELSAVVFALRGCRRMGIHICFRL